MEEKSLIEYEWAFEESELAKKIYKITNKGLDCLLNWIETLENHEKYINRVIEKCKSAVNRRF